LLLLAGYELHGSQEVMSLPSKTCHLVFQTAGFAGFVSGGIGCDLGDRFTMDLLLGYIPEFLGGEDFFSFTLKASFAFLASRDIDTGYRAYAGVSLIYSSDEDTFVVLPDKYPRGYYPPTAFRSAAYVGFETRVEKCSWYIEIASLDLYLEAKVRNWTQLGWDEVASLGLGFKYYFGDNSSSK